MEETSILRMAMGALEERVNLVMQQVMENIQDPNTRADKKRGITITLEFLPNTERSDIRVTSVVKAKLEPTNPIASTFCLGHDDHGELIAAEMTTSLPGQMRMDGSAQSNGIVIPLTKAL